MKKMKEKEMKVFTFILALVALSLGSSGAHAASASGKSYHVKFSVSNLSTSSYTELEAATSNAVVGFSVFNTSPNPVDLAVGASGSEVVHFTIPQGTLPGNGYPGSPTGLYNATPLYVPMRIAAGRRLALKSKDSTNNRGELQLNLIYQ
jgi:hypothetical protein